MPWEFIFPNLIAGDAPLAADLLTDLHAETLMDSDAFAAFYQRSARSLWAYLVRVSSDPALADDLMQESFVRFLCSGWRELSLAEGEVAARKYLFRIATNLLRDHWRRPSAASIDEIPDEFFAASDLTGQADSQAILGPGTRPVAATRTPTPLAGARRRLLAPRDCTNHRPRQRQHPAAAVPGAAQDCSHSAQSIRRNAGYFERC